MNAKNLAYLQLRLKQLGADGQLATSDECRSAILSYLAADMYCGLFRTAKGLKGLNFNEAWALCFGQPFETRERKERVARAKRRAG